MQTILHCVQQLRLGNVEHLRTPVLGCQSAHPVHTHNGVLLLRPRLVLSDFEKNGGVVGRSVKWPVILTGWKEISKHLRFGVRTVQRWERKGLPVKRVNKSPRSPVVADSEELDAWILHRIQLPTGTSRKLADNLQRAKELQRKAQEIEKELRGIVDVLGKTIAEARAARSERKKGCESGQSASSLFCE